MERFIVGAALVFAAIVAFGGVVGWSSMNIDFGDDEGGAPVTVAQSLPGEAAASGALNVYRASTLRVEDVTAVVTIIPEDRSDLAVTIAAPPGSKPISGRTIGDRLILDGRSNPRCAEVEADTPAANLPHITVRMPRDVELQLSGALRTQIGSAQSVDLSLSGCGPTTLGDVQDRLDLSIAGSGDLKAGDVGKADLSVAGAGSALVGAISQGLDVSIAGSGDVTVERLDGNLDASIAGSGRLTIQGGSVRTVDASIAGSGAVVIETVVDTLDASVMGSGAVQVMGVRDSVDTSVMGSGVVTAPRAPTPPAPPSPPVEGPSEAPPSAPPPPPVAPAPPR